MNLTTRLTQIRHAFHDQNWRTVWELADPDYTDGEHVLWDYLEAHMGTQWCLHRLDAPTLQTSAQDLHTFLASLPQPADLRGAQLAAITLVRAPLAYADLSCADLTASDLRHADLRNTNLQHATLTKTKLDFAHVNAKTRWPSSYTHPPTQRLLGSPHTTRLTTAPLPNTPPNVYNLAHQHLAQRNFARLGLQHSNFRNTNLQDTQFTRSYLDFADFTEATLDGANFNGAHLHFADFTRTDLSNTRFHQALYNAHTLWPEGFDPLASGALGPNAHLVDEDLSEENLQHADLRGAVFTKCNLRQANFIRANLSHTTFVSCSLDYANFTNCDLSHTNIIAHSARNVFFSGADLTHANLSKSIFQHCNLESATLSHANLCDTQLVSCQARYVRISHARASHTTFLGVDFDQAHIDSTDFSASTYRDVYAPHRRAPYFADTCFEHVQIQGWSFPKHILRTQFRNVRFKNCNFARIFFESCIFEDVVFEECNLAHADMRHCVQNNISWIACDTDGMKT